MSGLSTFILYFILARYSYCKSTEWVVKMKSRKSAKTESKLRFKKAKDSSRNVLNLITAVNHKNFKPPDLSMFKKKMVQALKSKE